LGGTHEKASSSEQAKGHYSMTQPPDFAPGAEFIDAPRDPDLRALHKLWLAKRGNRQLPSRVDFDPSDFKNLLQDFFVYNVEPTEGSFTVRLIGERLRDFIGTNVRGKPAGSAFQPEGTTALVRYFVSVAHISRAIRTIRSLRLACFQSPPTARR
jgi:hypothetical protein